MPKHRTTPFVCPHCGQPLGQTDGHRLYIAGVIIDRRVRLACANPACVVRRVWRQWEPLEQRIEVLTEVVS